MAQVVAQQRVAFDNVLLYSNLQAGFAAALRLLHRQVVAVPAQDTRGMQRRA